MMYDMTNAQDIMSKKVITIETTSSITEIAKIMNKNNINCIVLTENKKPDQGFMRKKI